MKILLIILLLAPCMMQHGSQRQHDEIQITTSSEQARSLYLDAREFSEKMDFGNAILLINKALKIDPDFALAYLLKARQTSNYKDQVYNLRKAEELSYKISDGERFLVLYYVGVFNSNTRMQEKYMARLTDFYPWDKRVQIIAASDKYITGDYQKALEHLVKAIEIDPFFYPAYNLIGYCKAELDETKENEKLFQEFQTVILTPFAGLI